MAQLRQLSKALPYQPMPLFRDTHAERSIKLDLNSLCIKRPLETFIIQVNNPHLLAWGIEENDLLIIEESQEYHMNDMLVIEKNNEYKFYQFFNQKDQDKILFSLDSREPNLTIQDWKDIKICGVITNVVHQVRKTLSHKTKIII